MLQQDLQAEFTQLIENLHKPLEKVVGRIQIDEPIQNVVVSLDNEYIVRNGGLPEPVTVPRIAKKRKSVMVLGTCLTPVGDLQHLSLRDNIIGHVSMHFIVVLEGCDSIEPNRAICDEVS